MRNRKHSQLLTSVLVSSFSVGIALALFTERAIGMPVPSMNLCDEAQKALKEKVMANQNPDAADLAFLTNCRLVESNKGKCKNVPADQPCGDIAVLFPPPKRDSVVAPDSTNSASTKADPPPASLEIYDVSTPDGIKKACAGIAASVAFGTTGDPLLAAIAGPAGAYECDSYMKAAARKDPMLILLPSAIPVTQLISDLEPQATALADKLGKNPLAWIAVPGAVVAVQGFAIGARTVLPVLKDPIGQTGKVVNGAANAVSGAAAAINKPHLTPIDVIATPIAVPVRIICIIGIFGKCKK